MAEPPPLEEQMSGWWEVEAGLQSGQIQAVALADANDAAADDAITKMKRAIGSDLQMRNFAGKATAKSKIDGQRSTLTFAPAGLFALVSNGATRHTITKPDTAVTRLASGRFMSGTIRHPGMRPLGRPLKDTLKTVDTEFLDSYGNEIDGLVL
jgi:hypothetical protein